MSYHTLTINTVMLSPTADYTEKNPTNPTLVFNISVVTRADLMRVNVDPAPLEVNPTLTKAMDGIRCLVNVGLAFSELNPIAKTVMSLVDLGVTQFDSLLKRNESVLHLMEELNQVNVLVMDWDNPRLKCIQQFDSLLKRNESVLHLMEELNQVNVLVMDWDNPSHVEHQPHRERVCRELLPEISQCLNLLQQLSQEKRLPAESIRDVDIRRKKLGELVKRLESNQHLDTQNAVFDIKETIKKQLYKDILLSKLYFAKNGGAAGSKVCLEGTRVALLQRIYDWALNPLGERVFLKLLVKQLRLFSHSIAQFKSALLLNSFLPG
ncbi:hypothetical protein H0H92_008055 [Tricholoma furcatifolium]|nr:hypothetical protein H0H92_008055 [Tricholoma furcatifolium]